jgi:SAM-dependent methyltransferase
MHADSRQEDMRALTRGLLTSVGRISPSAKVLEIHHTVAPLLDPDFLHLTPRGFGVSLSLNKGSEPDFNQPIVCKSASLPFQDRVFDMVVLQHVVSNGMEPELYEAARILARDGVLIILGLNRLGWRFSSQGRLRRLPGIAPLKVKSSLDRLDMTLQGFAGAGLLGMRRPVFMSSGLAGLGSPIADIVLLQARHSGGPEATPLNFRKSRSSVVQSA